MSESIRQILERAKSIDSHLAHRMEETGVPRKKINEFLKKRKDERKQALKEVVQKIRESKRKAARKKRLKKFRPLKKKKK